MGNENHPICYIRHFVIQNVEEPIEVILEEGEWENMHPNEFGDAEIGDIDQQHPSPLVPEQNPLQNFPLQNLPPGDVQNNLGGADQQNIVQEPPENLQENLPHNDWIIQGNMPENAGHENLAVDQNAIAAQQKRIREALYCIRDDPALFSYCSNCQGFWTRADTQYAREKEMIGHRHQSIGIDWWSCMVCLNQATIQRECFPHVLESNYRAFGKHFDKAGFT